MHPDGPEIVIALNGEERRVPAGTTLSGLLAILSLPAQRVAVEHNHEIVPKARFETQALGDGDRVEIVHFVGGG
jgi:thiamine biosynthesis protein ThiS